MEGRDTSCFLLPKQTNRPPHLGRLVRCTTCVGKWMGLCVRGSCGWPAVRGVRCGVQGFSPARALGWGKVGEDLGERGVRYDDPSMTLGRLYHASPGHPPSSCAHPGHACIDIHTPRML